MSRVLFSGSGKSSASSDVGPKKLLPVVSEGHCTFTVTAAVSELSPEASLTVYVKTSWPQKFGFGV